MEKLAKNVHLDEGLAKSVLRFRAVCKEWLRIIARPAFPAEHARRRPLEVLLYTRTRHNAADHLELDAMSVTAHRPAPRRPLARFPENRNWTAYWQYCRLLGSCDGLLLLETSRTGDGARQYLVCNPATRQWSDLPQLDGRGWHREFGFYFHVPTGEYRLLCYVSGQLASSYYCVFSAGAEERRRLTVQATGFSMGGTNSLMAPAVLRGHYLHWLDHITGKMLAFDTVAETFRWMPPPPVTRKDKTNLLAADGSLMASEVLMDQPLVDLWVLEGYGGTAERWERRHRVRIDGGVVAYNMRSGTVRKVVGVDASSGGDPVLLWPGVFRESLVRHGFFEVRPHLGLPLFSLL